MSYLLIDSDMLIQLSLRCQLLILKKLCKSKKDSYTELIIKETALDIA